MLTRISPVVIAVWILAVIGLIQTFIASPVQVLVFGSLTVLLYWMVRNYLAFGKFLPRAHKPAGKPSRPSTVRKTSTRKTVPFQVIEGRKGKTDQNDSDEQSGFYP